MLPDSLKWLFWRRFIFFFGGKNIRTSWRSYVDKYSHLDGNNYLGQGSKIIRSQIGAFSYSAGASISHATVGKYCSVARDAVVGGLGRHPTDWLSTHPIFFSPNCPVGESWLTFNEFSEYQRTYIGHDVWIGARAIVLDGVTIGHGAIIAAGAVVVSDVEPYSIVGGVPAKLIKYRFSPEIISVLMEKKWWDLDVDQLKVLSPLLVKNIESGAEYIKKVFEENVFDDA